MSQDSQDSTAAEEHARRAFQINGFRTGNQQNLRDARGDIHLVRVDIRVTLPHRFDYMDEGHRATVVDEIQEQVAKCLPTVFENIQDRLPDLEH